jgi:hypothetical protein
MERFVPNNCEIDGSHNQVTQFSCRFFLKGACAEEAASGLQQMAVQGEEESACIIGSSGTPPHPAVSVHAPAISHIALAFSSYDK